MISSKNKKINFLYRIYISIGIFGFTILLIFYAIALPTINEIEQLNKDILNQKIELEKKINREKNKTQLIENIKKIEPEISLLDDIFLNSNKELEFITILEGIANKHKVEQTINLSLTTTKQTSLHKVIILNVSVEGRYFDVLEYLKSIESLKHYINIYSLNINLQGPNIKNNTKSIKNVGQQEAKLNFEAETFWK